ncbi:hypothetical protein [Streptomyces noursei]|uniref:hypothetical protein n=1 Tax=Streptomyces noursei TaxID=1971 RepID=UPI00167ACDC3|nr:hypothetical protein [Streptomyces noursei]MCZ1014184.1 hypothetical protein [Streptomyces noursei]GGX23794.1 hypothetical protein GCM10010341_51210 [Streptomyces noursei]
MTTQKQPQTMSSVTVDTPTDKVLKLLTRDGGVIVENFLTKEQVNRFNAEIEPPPQALRPGSAHENDTVAAFHGSNTKRLTNLVTR